MEFQYMLRVIMKVITVRKQKKYKVLTTSGTLSYESIRFKKL